MQQQATFTGTRPMNASELTDLIKRRAVAQGKSRPARKIQDSSEATERVRKQAAYKLPEQYNSANSNPSEFVTNFLASNEYRSGTTASQDKTTEKVTCCEPFPNEKTRTNNAIVCSQPIRGSQNDVRCFIPTNVTPRSGVRTLPTQLPGGIIPSCNSGLGPSNLRA